MTPRRLVLSAILLAVVASWYTSAEPPAVTGALPDHLSDRTFWALSLDLSEPDGYFRSDNLISNETWLQQVIPELQKRTKPGRVYVGVGPEQNFTYIAAVKPAMAFIVDVRRGNLHLHLMYKALFELSADRAEFVSRLFARKRPGGLTAASGAADIFTAYGQVPASEAVYLQNVKAIRDHLVVTRGLPLGSGDLAGIETVAHAFYTHGPGINYNSSRGSYWRRMPSYVDLMLATDESGQRRAFLATEEAFAFLKDLHSRNLIVPVVGNFGGPKALRAVGRYIRSAGSTVSAFYLSNVEQYLAQQDFLQPFCTNVATMPLDEHSTFIRSVRSGRGTMFNTGYRYPGLMNELGAMQDETAHCR